MEPLQLNSKVNETETNCEEGKLSRSWIIGQIKNLNIESIEHNLCTHSLLLQGRAVICDQIFQFLIPLQESVTQNSHYVDPVKTQCSSL